MYATISALLGIANENSVVRDILYGLGNEGDYFGVAYIRDIGLGVNTIVDLTSDARLPYFNH